MKQTWHLIGRSVDALLLIVHWGFLDACLDVIFIWDFDMLDYWWLILLHCLAYWFWFWHDLFWSLHMHTLTIVYHSAWHVDSLTCILFWLSLSMMFVSLFVLIVIFSLILCVHVDISEFCLIVCCMIAFLCVIVCCLSMWVAHLSPYLRPSSLGHFLHSGSHFCKCEALCVLVL